MDQYKTYTGYFSTMGNTVQIFEKDGQLVSSFPGMPPGFEIILEPQTAVHTFRLRGGPLSGSLIVFHPDETGIAHQAHLDDFELNRVDEESAQDPHAPRALQAPSMELDTEKEAAFTVLFEQLMAERNGRYINYTLPYPKHEFLRYASMQDQLLFHGSNNDNIEEFLPIRKSYELHDSRGRGNIQGVYATHDGLWPMYFALIDRENYKGTLRNGVMYLTNDDGEEKTFYNFSINKEMADKNPWRSGTLYFLPRDTFVRLHANDETLSNEWASEQPVKPVAKLAIHPEDFPFLDQVGLHDDSVLTALDESWATIAEHTASVAVPEEKELVVILTLNWQDTVGDAVLDYIAQERKLTPAVSYNLQFTADNQVLLHIQGPPAYLQVIKNRLKHLL